MATPAATNTAAWLTSPKARPLNIAPSPLGVPTGSQVLVRNRAIAINPADVKTQQGVPYPVTYPAILGQDVAGEVIAVGPDAAARFKEGDRVAGCAAGFITGRAEEKAFQEYTLVESNLAFQIPASMSFEQAVVVPLGLCTAAACLFAKDFLNLQLPTEPRRQPTGKVLLVWGGASSVGLNAIQLAVAAGYEVITTCSPSNFQLVKHLGATHAFDYNTPSVIDDLVTAVGSKPTVGALHAMGDHEPCIEFVQRTEGPKFVATAVRGFAPQPDGVVVKQCMSLSVKDDGVGRAVFEDYLEKALEAGSFVAAPEPLVAGRGLEALQDAMDLKAGGVSAKKVVVVL